MRMRVIFENWSVVNDCSHDAVYNSVYGDFDSSIASDVRPLGPRELLLDRGRQHAHRLAGQIGEAIDLICEGVVTPFTLAPFST